MGASGKLTNDPGSSSSGDHYLLMYNHNDIVSLSKQDHQVNTSISGATCMQTITSLKLSTCRRIAQGCKIFHWSTVTPRPPRGRPVTPGSCLGSLDYPHRPTLVFSAHFVLTRAYPGRGRSPIIGVLFRWASGKEVATCWYEYPINPIKP
jgi:hypothetical protein